MYLKGLSQTSHLAVRKYSLNGVVSTVDLLLVISMGLWGGKYLSFFNRWIIMSSIDRK